MSDKMVSKHTIEIRFRPDAGFLDKRGVVAEHIASSATPFKRWNVSANRIDFSSDDNQHVKAFISYRNMGVVSTPPNDTGYFVETAEAFIGAAWSQLPNRDLSRIGILSMCFIETKDFDKAVDAYRKRFLKLTDEELSGFRGKLIDIGFPLNFVDGKDHFNVITGPMKQAQAGQFFRDAVLSPSGILQESRLLHADDSGIANLPAVGLYVSVDFFRTDFPNQNTTTTILELLRRGIKKAQGIADLIAPWVLEPE